jgi:hypothetical protein
MLLVIGIAAISLGASALAAAQSTALQEHATVDKAAPSRSVSRAPTATQPARYYIPHVQELININNTFCSTAIIITVPWTSPGSVEIEVEVFSDTGVTEKLDQVVASSSSGVRWTVVTDSEIKAPFKTVDSDLDLANFLGFAVVSANDPRIYVTAYDYCRTGTGALDHLVSMNSITVYPVGATLEFLKAGLPDELPLPRAAESQPDSSR